jgi:hypothetical protein
MGFKVRFECQDYVGDSDDCVSTSIPNVFTDVKKGEIIIILFNQAVVISL